MAKKSINGEFIIKTISEVYRGDSNLPEFPRLTESVAELALVDEDNFMAALEAPIRVTIETDSHKVLGEFYFSVLRLMQHEYIYDINPTGPSSKKILGLFSFKEFELKAAGTTKWHRK